MIIAVLGEKGGTGKTTFATNLAGMRATSGRDVLILDADKQGSAGFWVEERAQLKLPSVHCLSKLGKGILREAKDLAKRYDDVIIDVAAGDGEEIEAALRAADRVLIPLQPSAIDTWTMGLVNRRVGEARSVNENLVATVVLNRGSTNPKDTDTKNVREVLANLGHLEIAKSEVRDRVSIKRSAHDGRCVLEYKPADDKAIGEFEKVYKLMFGRGLG